MRLAHPVLLVLALIFALAPPARGQATGPPQVVDRSAAFRLEQNYPNPVSPETWIPFYLEESLFQDGEPGRVSIRIYNVLRQLVAVPRAVDYQKGKSPPVLNLPYAEPGPQVAYWDGRDTSGKLVPTGVYYCQMIVDQEEPKTRKLIVVNQRRRSKLFPWFRKGSR